MISSTASCPVIVGMRISKLLNIFYIEIAEGKLESNGYISDFSWVPVERMLHEESRRPVEIENVHMHRRVFFFADLQLPPAFVLTGVNFIQTIQNRIQGFSVEIHGVKFDYTTGKLDLMDAQTVTYTGSEIERQLVYKGYSSVSMEPFEPQRPDSRGHTSIVLRQSDLDSDFGQSTLPFFDGVPVVTNPPSPIGGVGLFHEGDTDHAGFLSLRTYPIDYLHFLNITLQTFDFNLLSTWND